MCYACKTEQEFQEVVEELRDELKEEVQFFPRVFVIGKTEKIVAFYVVTSSMQFKLPSFLRCIDLVVKLKFVLNYNFPESCELFWYFVAKYFYHIGYSRKAKNSQLLQLLAYLEHWESITCTAICAITCATLFMVSSPTWRFFMAHRFQIYLYSMRALKTAPESTSTCRFEPRLAATVPVTTNFNSTMKIYSCESNAIMTISKTKMKIRRKLDSKTNILDPKDRLRPRDMFLNFSLDLHSKPKFTR